MHLKISMKNTRYFFFLCFMATLVVSCHKDPKEAVTPTTNYENGEELSAGVNGTVFDESVNAFNNAIPGLNFDDNSKFVVGNSLNRNNWVIAPSSTTGRDGLGPMFNANSCSGCHPLDSRGRPPLFPTEGLTSMVVRLSIPGTTIHGEPMPLPNYGDQLNTKGIHGIPPEGNVTVNYEELAAMFDDGGKYSLRKPTYQFTDLGYGAFPSDAMFSPRIAPKMTGVGVLDGIEELDILSYEDPNDANNDGISGRANKVWDAEKNKHVIGRVGWKANQPNVRHQVMHALLGDIGITSSLFNEESLFGVQKEKYGNLPTGGNPEISDTALSQLVYYTSALAMPARRNVKDAEVLKGKVLFAETGCVKCHRPKYVTGTHPEVVQLSNQVIYPYTDLLLHDMGIGLADNRPDNQATGNEWRTAPLWGLGLSKIQGNYYLLHDGRARSIEEAILWHGGEAANAKSSFVSMPEAKRKLLIKFLESL